MPRVLNIVGCKNSGKTRTVEVLVPVLQKLGLKIGTLKHTEHDGFNWDAKGKDTYRHFEAGSSVTGIFGKSSFAFNFNNDQLQLDGIDNLIRVFYGAMDLVLVEGLKTDPSSKIEVCRPDFTDRKVVPETELLATYGANLFGYKVPHFDYGQEAGLGKHIVENLEKLREVGPA